MSDLPLTPSEHVSRPEFLTLRDDVKRVERDLAVMNDRQALVQTDLDGIRSDLRDIKGELKNMRGWKQFLLTGGIGVGWGVVQGIFHLFGVGSAP